MQRQPLAQPRGMAITDGASRRGGRPRPSGFLLLRQLGLAALFGSVRHNVQGEHGKIKFSVTLFPPPAEVCDCAGRGDDTAPHGVLFRDRA